LKNQSSANLLLIVGICLAFSTATFGQTLDLSDRDRDFRYRIFYDPNDLLEGCQQNFSDEPCGFRIGAHVEGPLRRSSDSSEPLVGLPDKLHNQLVNDGGQPERICSYDERAELAATVNSNNTNSDTTEIIAIPHDLYHCFSSEKRGAEESTKLFLFEVGGSIVGETRCRVPGAVPNPACRSNFFPSNGRYFITIGSFPLRNLRKLLKQSPAMVERFLSGVPIPFPADFVWRPMPERMSILFPTEMAISELEAGL
jgi:hypothetical protein